MIKAAFVTQHANFPWKRQLPAGGQVFAGVEFFAPVDEAAIVFVYDALPKPNLVLMRPVVTVFVASEPKNVKRYNHKFLAQFDAVITSDRRTRHRRPIFIQAGLPWHVGCMAAGSKLLDTPLKFEDFENHFPNKTKLVSVVASDKAFTAEHRARLAFVAKLKDALGDRIDVFGRGIVDFADKRDVLDEYKYHVALENCSIEDYWTEKLADPYLTLTFPIYHGCPNVTRYFSDDALRVIDIHKPVEAIETIKQVIGSDLAERSREALIEARQRVMHEHNAFAMLARVATKLVATNGAVNPERQRILYDESAFLPLPIKLGLCLRYRIGRLKSSPRSLIALKRRYAAAIKAMRHWWRYCTDGFYRSHQRWITDNPNEDLRFAYDLPDGANILDVGGYLGDFAARFVERYDAHVTVFEPVTRFAALINQRFAGNPKVRVYAAGLSGRDIPAVFDVAGDASGAFAVAGSDQVMVDLWDVDRVLGQFEEAEWHLVKLNIEGGEYEVINRLIDSGRIATIKYLQVQFHLHVPAARAKYRELAKRLRRTHELQWRYPFVWESWVRRRA